jgi:N-acyl-D-amino-acid deacylase
MAFETIIKNGFVVNGTGNPWFKADVGISQGKIAQVGKLGDIKAQRIIDAKGLVVSPGFIDMHAHSELVYFGFPKAEAKIMQGVTTEFNCQCGTSCYPLNGMALEQIQRQAKSVHLSSSFINSLPTAGWNSSLSSLSIS